MNTAHLIAIACVAVLLAPAALPGQGAKDRVGLEESFDSMAGWKKLDFAGEEAPLKEMKSTGGVGLSPEMKEFHHKLAGLWITNDPSFRPAGYDPQADLTKASIKRR